MDKRNREIATFVVFISVIVALLFTAYLFFGKPTQALSSQDSTIEDLYDLLFSVAENPIGITEQIPEESVQSALSPEIEQTTAPTPQATEITIPFEPTAPEPDPGNLLVNGYFLDGYDGWKRELIDEGGSSKTNIVSFGSSQFNKALHLKHEGLGDIIFTQTVNVPSTNLVFSASFNASSTEGLIWGFSGTGYAMIIISYEDTYGEQLGFTRIINFNENLFAGSAFVGSPEKLSDSNTTHNYQIDSDKTYMNFSIDIQNELQNNILGINAAEVKSITIAFIAGSNDKNATADLIVGDVVLKQK